MAVSSNIQRPVTPHLFGIYDRPVHNDILLHPHETAVYALRMPSHQGAENGFDLCPTLLSVLVKEQAEIHA